jgi:hypothetical protein
MDVSRRWAVTGVVLLLSGLVAVPARPVAAATGAETLITFLSMRREVNGDIQRAFHPGNADITVRSTGNLLDVDVSPIEPESSQDHDFRFRFGAPGGAPLEVGSYPHARDSGGRRHAELSVAAEGDIQCPGEGAFTIKEIQFEGGEPSSFWITYRCLTSYLAIFGELRYNVPGDGGAFVVGPRTVRWPPVDRLYQPPATPITLVNPGPDATSLRSATLSPRTSSAITLDAAGCQGVVLEANESCTLDVRLTTGESGPKTGSVVLEEESGFTRTIPLRGHVIRGETSLSVTSTKDDPIGRGRSSHLNFSNALLGGGGDHGAASFGAERYGGGTDFLAQFDPPGDRRLKEDRVYRVHGGWGFVSGNGVACQSVFGHYVLTDIVYEHDSIIRFRATFDQRCKGSKGHLRGELLWRHLPAREA